MSNNYLICHNCHGHGLKYEKKCITCKGLGVVYFLQDKVLFWGRKINRWHLWYESLERTINIIINICLLVFGLAGVIVMVYLAYLNKFEEIVTLEHWLVPSFEKAFFWFTLLTDLFLYYRFEQEFSIKKKVLIRNFKEKHKNLESLSWATILKLKKKDLVDISLAFNKNSLIAVNQSWELAKKFSHSEVKRIHLFSILPQLKEGLVIFSRLAINFNKFKEKLSKILSWKIDQQSPRTELSSDFKEVLIKAYVTAFESDQERVRVLDLMSALIKVKEEKDYIEKLLVDLDLNYEKIENVVMWVKTQEDFRQRIAHFKGKARYKPKKGMNRSMTATATPLLDQFAEDLTLAAKNGQLFPCIGREKEIEKIFRVFEGSRASSLLIGNVGVGKTTILHGIAQLMVEERVPEKLKDKRLVVLSVPRLISGVNERKAEERLLAITNEISVSGNIVLAIENVHDLVSIGGDDSGLDLSEVLVQILERHSFFCVGTTIPEEFNKVIENRSLDSVFQEIKVEEVEPRKAIQILELKSGAIEYEQKVFFSYDSIDKAVQLSSRYLHDQYLPKKALEIIEQVAAQVKKDKGENQWITGNDVAKYISETIKIPLTKITAKESQKLLNLEEEIHNRIIGQEEAVKTVASALRRARAELRDSNKPIANLLFLGPTGVGKTELAKSVTEVYFGDEKNMLRFDMSEYQQQDSIKRLIGYADRPGLLTEAVRKKPFSVLLLDEIEKADDEILNLFLQVMEDGRLTDAQGRTIDFTNVILIMTSNAGAFYIQDEIKKGTEISKIKNALMNEELRENFRPEFLNRFDGIIVFKPLTMENVLEITRLLIKKEIKKLKTKEINLKISDAVIAELAEIGYDQKFGARPLKRAIQENVEDVLATYLLSNKITKRDNIILKTEGRVEVEKGEIL